VDEAAFALAGRAGQHATEILQFVVLHEAVAIAVIMSVGRASAADAILSDGEIGLRDMSGVLAHERKDTENLRNQKDSDNPWTQTARCGGWKHRAVDRLLRLAMV
jgi:hypothetical protein